MGTASNMIERLSPALAASRYLQREVNARPWLLPQLEDTLDTAQSAAAMREFLKKEALDETRLGNGLRRLRSWVLCHTATRDLLGLADLAEVTGAMTQLAEVSVTQARDVLHRALAERHGFPVDGSGQPMQLVVVGMGKLGGCELNVSSDIDLVFLYPEEGETAGARPLSHFDFFTRLGRSIIAAIGEVTADGYVFRVDMRLRPYGESGPLVLSFDALEQYFIAQGREWERFAWIKARPLCGDRPAELAAVVRPFVFRKYLDFGAINALRSLHAQIRSQVARREMAMNIKLGPGGIREIEFIAQVFQIIRGGRDAGLRIKPTTMVLEALAERGVLSGGTVRELIDAYVFLRRLEHRLQYLDDAQTHDLPASPADRRAIASAMGFQGEAEMLAELDRHRRLVTAAFQAACGDPNDTVHTLDGLWDAKKTSPHVEAGLAALNFNDPAAASNRLAQLRQGSGYRLLPENIRIRLDAIMPRVIEGCAAQPDPDAALSRMLNLLATISRRGGYLTLLQQYPQALCRLIELVSSSKWAADYLTTHPILLDELLDGRLGDVTDWSGFARRLRQDLNEADPDTERQMDLMREQHHAQVLHILHQDIAGKWAVEAIGDHLSAVADVILAETMRLCWHKYAKRHRETPQFAVIGYGKLGGKELGYASDLDIVFLYDDDHPSAPENYARLAQRMLSWLSTRTSAGLLFETDTRLRPNGNSGMLVCPLASFIKYQHESAWLWEHQALTRARFVAGDAEVGHGFEAAREAILRKPRQLSALAEEVMTMRRKLYDSRSGGGGGGFHVKDDPGGLIDFEFIIQYLVLGHAHDHPQLVANLGNIALARIAGELGLVDAARAKAAADGYRTLRRIQHRLRLNGESDWLPKDGATAERQAVIDLWDEVFGQVT